MNWRPLRAQVEFMDGEKREYSIGGFIGMWESAEVKDGVLILSQCDSQFAANKNHVASLPLANIREWMVTARG